MRVPRSKTPITPDSAFVLQVARRFWLSHDKPTQQTIAEEMATSQSRISRALRLAEERGWIQVQIQVPRLEQLSERLRRVLNPLGIRQVRVVPDGIGKNIENLGTVAAEVLAGALKVLHRSKAPGSPLSLALSCGSTIRSAIHHFLEMMERDDELCAAIKERGLEVRPASLRTDAELNLKHPHGLVSTLAVLGTTWLEHRFGAGAASESIRAYPVTLPGHYYGMTREAQVAYLAESGIAVHIERARQADVILSGVGVLPGVTGDQDNEFKPIRGVDLGGCVGEILYIPIRRDGSPHPEYADYRVGLGIANLEDAAEASDRFVIGVAGGDRGSPGCDKVPVLRAALARRSLVNQLVTDEAHTRSLISGGLLSV